MEYQSIKKPIENILVKEKGSKFIGFAYPITTIEEFKYFLNQVQKNHPKATHCCYSYRIGKNGEHYRINDDGEPSGSAGLPIYNQLLSKNVTNILLIIIRYFGGTKLGINGLIKTYKECAQITLEKAEFIIKELESEIKIQFIFSQQNMIFSLLNKFDAKNILFDVQENCNIKASIKTSQKEKISEILSEMNLISFEFIT